MRALTIGINDYPGTSSDLNGCVNDAADWSEVLTARGYVVAQLLDSDATRANMVDAIRDTIESTKAGEAAVITYSGHGTWLPDGKGDEPDGKTEAWCPTDAAEGQLLTDDNIHDLCARRPDGTSVVLISDSCHSGTVARHSGLGGDGVGRARYLAPDVVLSGKDVSSVRLRSGAAKVEPYLLGALLRPRCRRAHEALLLSGCMDWEYSFDAQFDGRPNGAFTRAALQTLAELPDDAAYKDWHREIRRLLPSGYYPQTPNLQGSAEMRAARVFG